MATNNAINAPFPFTASQGGTGVIDPTNHGILIGQAASPVATVVLSNAEILVGVTASDPIPTALIGVGLSWSFDSGLGTLTATVSGGGSTTVEVTGTTQAMAVNTIYIANNAGVVTFTLPATAAIGETVEVIGKGAGGWTIEQAAGQLQHIGDQVSTTGITGSLSSTDQWDCLVIKCITADDEWTVTSAIGNITYV